MSTAIEFENISKQYRLGLVSTGTLSHDLNRFWQTKVLRREDPYLKVGEVNDRAHKGASEYVWALKDINFKVEQGDVVGIIGRNGAGKSTLLKLLSRVTAPTTGTIRARGRIASLLEVGTGFHPEMTGRENIYMNGAIMGMSRAEITRKLDEIVDFSGCERYLDTPVKRYSSGMTVRLGFAIAAHLDPEILVVDEVLAVGDAEFQKKAIGKMQDVSRGEGRTVLFVSHNMNSILQLCKTGVMIDEGTIVEVGDIKNVVNHYQSKTNLINKEPVLERNDRRGNNKLKLNKIYFKDAMGRIVENIKTGDSFTIVVSINQLDWKFSDEIDQFTIAFNDTAGNRILVFSNSFLNKKIVIDLRNDITNIDFVVEKCPLVPGTYDMAFFLSDSFGNIVDWIDNVAELNVLSGDFFKSGKFIRERDGLFLTNYSIKQ